MVSRPHQKTGEVKARALARVSHMAPRPFGTCRYVVLPS